MNTIITKEFIDELQYFDSEVISVDNYNAETVLHFADRDSAIAAMNELMSRLFDGALANENANLTIELRNNEWLLIEREAEEEEE